MPTDSANILPLLDTINAAARQFTETGGFADHATRQRLIRAAESLAIAAREPEENLYFTATQTAQNAAIRSAIGMGAFDAIPADGRSISAQELADKLAVEKKLVVRVIRGCTSTHVFTETSEEHYTHNPFSRTFLTPSNRDMFKQMYDFLGKGVYSLPEYLPSTGWKNPEEYDNSAFNFGHKTKLGFWDYLKQDPERLKVFNSGMRSLATIGTVTGGGPYPFGEELGTEKCAEGEALLVDVGGGRGQALEAIRESFPELEGKGKLVLQDLPDVIADAKAGGLHESIEVHPASFFEPQPIKGARAYHFRRIFHDWSDAKSREILRNTVQAMAPHSRILISDTVVPNVNAPRDMALQDLNMMCFGGMERTERQWTELLGDVGLRIVKIWRQDGAKHGMVEARLK